MTGWQNRYMPIQVKLLGFSGLLNTDIRFALFFYVTNGSASGKIKLFDAAGFLSIVTNPKTDFLEADSSVRNVRMGEQVSSPPHSLR